MSTADDKRDAKLDAMLADWPAPERDNSVWEDLESKLRDRIVGLSVGNGDDAWFSAPLPAEPSEGGDAQPRAAAGDVSMSGSEPEKPKKKSFKEIAQRVSVVPSVPSGAEPVPPSGRVSKPSTTPLPRDGNARAPLSRPSFVSRPPEARESDSGLLDLNAVRNSAASVPDDGALPGSSGIFDDVTGQPAPVVPIAVRPKAKSSVLPIVGGGLVAFAAIAAAAMLFVKRADSPADMSAAEAPIAMAPAENAPSPPPAASAGATPESLALATAAPAADLPGREATGAEDKAAGAEGAKPASKSDDTKDDKADDKKEPADPKDLEGAMAGAVGASKDEGDTKDKAAGPGVDPSSIPETPSQGAIQGALGSVMGAAKSCVAGMDAPSRASITFASSGTVTRVSVSGPASGQAAGGCIQAALKGARVGPFKRSSFTVGVTIRP